jgi:phage/conjugal plasmid C-4 type zinc finger TraR family protein
MNMDIVDAAYETEIHALEAALADARFALNDYAPGPDWYEGLPLCRECGTEIPKRRLEAVPGTGLCVDCAEERQLLRQ